MLAKIQQKIAGAKFKICSDVKTAAVPITLCVYSRNILRTTHSVLITSQRKVIATRQTKESSLLFFIA